MASYLSYFTSNGSSAPTQQQSSQAQPAASTWGNTFSSRIATLRKALTKGSEEDDPDNEDCSHVSNVLRAYYTQKGRAFPEWLPPDPKKPQPVPQALPQYGQYGQYPGNYGNQYRQPAHGRGPSTGGSLSDLWDSTPAPPQRQAPQSLRAQRPQAQTNRSYDSHGRPGTNDGYPPPNNQAAYANRTLPSQQGGTFPDSSVTSSSFGLRNNRIKARIEAGGSGRNSPAANQSNYDQYSDVRYNTSAADTEAAPYSSATQPWSSSGGGYDNYSSSGSNPGYGNTYYRQRPAGQR